MQRDWVEERKMKARREKNKLKDSRIRLACVWSKHSYLFLCIFSRSFVHWPVSCLFGFCSFTFDICVKSKRPKYQIVVIMSIDRHRRWPILAQFNSSGFILCSLSFCVISHAMEKDVKQFWSPTTWWHLMSHTSFRSHKRRQHLDTNMRPLR